MSITKITTHLNDALARLLFQFKTMEKIESLNAMQGQQIQYLEDASFDFLSKMSLQDATGAILDRWGVVLDEARLGDNDADYRSRLFFKIARNICSGTPEELILFFNYLLQTSTVQINELFPGVVYFTAVQIQNIADPVLVKSQLQQLCPAGVRIGWMSIGSNNKPFAFASHPNLDARGFDTYPVTGNGGEFVSAY